MGEQFSPKEVRKVIEAHMGVGFINALYNEKAEPPCYRKFECTTDCVVSSFCVHRR